LVWRNNDVIIGESNLLHIDDDNLLCVRSSAVGGFHCIIDDVLNSLTSLGTPSAVWHRVHRVLHFRLGVGV
uniref:Uncharacterized protein n=1 Tax=Ciona savignyi TaxID=51511 RepID=H2Y9K8_CIOSA